MNILQINVIKSVAASNGVLIWSDDDKNKLMTERRIIPEALGSKKDTNRQIECEPYLLPWSIAYVCKSLNFISIHKNNCKDALCSGCYEVSTNIELVLKDLIQKGYYITSASKFGGDFAIYATLPSESHSVSIVHVISDENVSSDLILRYGRVACLVRKTALLAFVDKDLKIKYTELMWKSKL